MESGGQENFRILNFSSNDNNINIEKLRNEQPENLVAVNDGGIQYVPDDIGNINVDEIVGKLGYVEGMYHTVNTIQPDIFYMETEEKCPY